MLELPGTQSSPHAAAVLGAGLPPAGSPSHAYLLHGQPGAGKAQAARAFAAVLLSEGVVDEAGARARVEHGTHSDLTWVTPSGAHELLVSDIEPVIATAWHTPFESRRRVFVIERADTLSDVAANKLLKTLEEPPSFVHILLLTDRLTQMLATITSRCQLVRFDSPSPEQITERLVASGIDGDTALACARLSLGDGRRARVLALSDGPALRGASEAFAVAALNKRMGQERPWQEIVASGQRQAQEVAATMEEELAADLELLPKRDRRRRETEHTEQSKRVQRRVRTESLDLSLALVGLWYRDMACLAWESADLVHHSDRYAALEACLGPGPEALRAAVELIEESRRRLSLNVSEELALEALAYRLEECLG
ncbi:MAG: hypothetical protein WCK06_09245 [Actinomycetota bacterium]